MNEIEALTQTRARVATSWGKGAYHRRVRRDGLRISLYCIVGALGSVCRVDPTGSQRLDMSDDHPYWIALRRLNDCLPPTAGTLEAFNDAEETTVDDVLALIDCALK